MRKIIFVFLTAFLLNLVWENLHAVFYDSYMGGPISKFILFRASVADAFMIATLSLPFLYSKYLKGKNWLIIIFGMLLALFIEWFALQTNWWRYNESMPIVPGLKVGLTPLVQLGLLGYLALLLCGWFFRERKLY